MKPCLILPFQDSMVDSLLQFAVTYKDRVRMDLIKPAVDWRAKTEQAAAASK
jgi:UDP-sulfoquinovose synthase